MNMLGDIDPIEAWEYDEVNSIASDLIENRTGSPNYDLITDLNQRLNNLISIINQPDCSLTQGELIQCKTIISLGKNLLT